MAVFTEAMERTLSIAEAAEASGLSAHTLRYDERSGLLEPVSRNGRGHRRYRAADLERIARSSVLAITRTRYGGHCGFYEGVAGSTWVERQVLASFDPG